MNENEKSRNESSQGFDNEAILQRKRAEAAGANAAPRPRPAQNPQMPQRPAPARQAQQQRTVPPAGAGGSAVPVRPVRTAGNETGAPGAVPPSSPSAPGIQQGARRPMAAQGSMNRQNPSAVRPAPPRRPAMPNQSAPRYPRPGADVRQEMPRPESPAQAGDRPAVAQSGTNVRTIPSSAPAATSPTPAYKSRRALPGVDAGTTGKNTSRGKSSSFTSSEERQDNAKDKNTSKAQSAKDGAGLMIGIVKAMAYMAIVLVVSVFISIFVIRIGNDVFAFVKSDEVIEITIDKDDANIKDISRILADNGIINFPGIFKMYASMKHDDGKFIPGTYQVSPSMSYDDLRYAFKEQIVTGTTWITIPEGSSVDEIIDIMVEKGIGKREKYIEVVNNPELFKNYWFVEELIKNPPREGRAYLLEGYLFPDTYEFYNASSEQMVINKLLARFEEVFVEDYRVKAAEIGYTVDEIITIASLVEKEAGKVSDYMYVSSVFHNRLNNSVTYPRLESDATTVYAIQIATGVRPDKVTPEDNQFVSPYNTYLNPGLTPGAITNPGASAIRYALYPAESTYYYFVTDNYGKTYFASGITEHTQNIEKVKQVNAQG